MRRLGWLIILMLSLVGCADSVSYAPVTDVSSIDPVPTKGTYRVCAEDTLYSIAWRYGLDYRYLAKINRIQPPYHIEPSQLIYLRPPHTPHSMALKLSPITIPPPNQFEMEPTATVAFWRWPAHGPIVGTFSERNKGINMGGHVGSAVYAAAAGRVVYSGNGLRAYGNLIIIKHNSVFLSAYAYNSKVLVKEGSWVLAGQKIAEIGHVAHEPPMLHFEIRRGGQPVNPLSYLGKR